MKIISALSSIVLVATAAVIYQRTYATSNGPSDAKGIRDFIWNAVVSDSHPAPWFSIAKVLYLFVEDMNTSFDYTSDWLPKGRDKLIHSQGVVGKAIWAPVGNHEFSGLFESGAPFGLIRLSLAKEPPAENAGATITPGVAVKFFRDNRPSANFMAMFSLDGQQSWNFFENVLSNHVSDPKDFFLSLLAKKFHTASKYETKVGLSDFAIFNANGEETSDPVFPYRLRLVPNPAIKASIAEITGNLKGSNWLTQFERVPANSQLFEVWAISDPSEDGTQGTHIANIVLDGELQTSAVADRHLYFQHVRMEEDFKHRLHWK